MRAGWLAHVALLAHAVYPVYPGPPELAVYPGSQVHVAYLALLEPLARAGCPALPERAESAASLEPLARVASQESAASLGRVVSAE